MISLRLPRLRSVSAISFPLSIFKNPLFFLIFFYFLTSSADLLNVYLLFFKVKLTNAIAFIYLLFVFFSKFLKIPKNFFILNVFILFCLFLSLWNSPNIIVSVGFIAFFIFNFFFYFLLPYNLFRFFPSSYLLKTYSFSFYCVGLYALCQLLFSLMGIILPGVRQFIGSVARGAAFAYEPSFYALYMTPFAIYSTTRFLLEHPSRRNFKSIFWPNLLMLVSTSTGCFFSYMFFLVTLVAFNFLKITKLKIRKILTRFALFTASFILIAGICLRDLVAKGFFKFFYGAKISHFSVQDRWRGLIEYWNIFLEHPLVGVSFGGGPFYLAKLKGSSSHDLLDPQILAHFSPMNVTTEVLASCGILGSLCFLCFFYLLMKTFRSSLQIPNLSNEERIILISFALSICVMFMTLQFNQSIMRAYMWIHIGIFCGYARNLETSRAPVS